MKEQREKDIRRFVEESLRAIQDAVFEVSGPVDLTTMVFFEIGVVEFSADLKFAVPLVLRKDVFDLRRN